VIGVVGHDHSAAAGRGAGDAEGEVVRLASRAGEHDVGQLGREEGQQALGIGQDAVVQVAGVRGERRGLLGHRLDNRGVAMADRGDVVVAVEIGEALWVEKMHALRPAPDATGFRRTAGRRGPEGRSGGRRGLRLRVKAVRRRGYRR